MNTMPGSGSLAVRGWRSAVWLIACSLGTVLGRGLLDAVSDGSKQHVHDPLQYGFSLAQGYETKLSEMGTVDPPIISIADPKYGMDEVGVFEESRTKFWGLLQDGRRAHSKRMTEDAGCFCDGFDNVTVWDETREIMCMRQHMLAKNDMPQKYVMDKAFLQKPQGGPAKAGLTFDPTTMKRHFKQYRALLQEYYEGKEILESAAHPTPTEPGYDEAVTAIARHLVRKVVHKKPFVIAVAGTSIMAGMDNCFAKTYGPMLTRILEPFFKGMGIGVEVRNSGQNGDGPAMEDTTQCIKQVMGADVDILQITYVMITPAPPADYEAFIRRTISDGTLLHATHRIDTTILEEADREAYHRSGLMDFTKEGLSMLDFDKTLYPWFPSLGRAHWGRVDDGYCHITTRDGSEGTIMQNWHPGPLGFQVYMDTLLHPYMDGFIRAMAMLEEKDAAALKIEFPVDANLYTMGTPLPPPSQCKKAEFAEHPMCKGETDHGFTDGPTCAVGQNPSWGIGSNLTDWLVPAGDATNPFKGDSSWAIKAIKKSSSIGGCRDKLQMRDPSAYKERPDCSGHLDTGDAFVGTKTSGWLTLKLPDMTKGDIQVCNFRKGAGYTAGTNDAAKLKPKFALNGRILTAPPGMVKPGDKVPFHPSVPSNKASTCMQVAVGAPELKGAYLSVSLEDADADLTLSMEISWIIVN
mmetsp:Transcript_37125/g.62490  ORF Transcript_37125/g.62490 Transcript_37125/m.62490 type:complete len:691 (-) Transcript_37125:665-2737(-)